MQPEIAQQLLELNHQFYQTFAEHFSETRQRIQPGVVKSIDSIPKTAHVLDLGCGNGQLAAHLNGQGYTGLYVGLDTSANLIEIAKQQNLPNAKFFQADLTGNMWQDQLPQTLFDTVVCFAVLHHIPSTRLRVEFLNKVRQHLSPNGLFIHSNWQFLQSPKLRRRIQPWEKVGLTADLVEEHDYLLDWRRGGAGFRYVHYYTSDELSSLADQTGFKVRGEFLSDGEGGRLGLYQVWEIKKN